MIAVAREAEPKVVASGFEYVIVGAGSLDPTLGCPAQAIDPRRHAGMRSPIVYELFPSG
jgi:hypothetical protein